MPIRNFYIDCEIDGRESRLTGGPRAKDGGFNLTIYQRSDGKKIKVLDVVGIAYKDMLHLDLKTHERFFPVQICEEVLITTQ